MLILFQIIYQRSGGECTPDKILMSLTDLKALGLKPGGLVSVRGSGGGGGGTTDSTFGDGDILCRCWPSKTASTGTAVMHRMHWPMLGASESTSSSVKPRTASMAAIDTSR
jgi:hypothetical protein